MAANMSLLTVLPEGRNSPYLHVRSGLAGSFGKEIAGQLERMPIEHERNHAATFCGGAALLMASSVHAQAWPSKPIKVIVPYTLGGFTDITARLVSQKLQDRLGQPVVIENKPGANSIIGVDALAKSPPDAYSFAVVIAAYAANTTLYPDL